MCVYIYIHWFTAIHCYVKTLCYCCAIEVHQTKFILYCTSSLMPGTEGLLHIQLQRPRKITMAGQWFETEHRQLPHSHVCNCCCLLFCQFHTLDVFMESKENVDAELNSVIHFMFKFKPELLRFSCYKSLTTTNMTKAVGRNFFKPQMQQPPFGGVMRL